MRVFLDANVLFSACKKGGAIGQLVRWLQVEGVVVTSDLAIEEARRNLLSKRAEWAPRLEELLHPIEVVPSSLFRLDVDLEAKDRPLLCAAIRAKCTHFATGDRRDFGALFGVVVEGVMVIDLRHLAELLAGKAASARARSGGHPEKADLESQG